MPDPRFFSVAGPYVVGELAEIGMANLNGDADPRLVVLDVAPIDTAGPNELSFIDNPRYGDLYRRSKAGACVVHPNRVKTAPPTMNLLVSETPYLSYARIASSFYPTVDSEPYEMEANSFVHPSAEIGAGVSIATGAVIKREAKIGDNVRIDSNAVIGPGVIIGDDCHIGTMASVYYCIMGNGVRLYAGVRIGEAGFGFAHDGTQFLSVPQLGRVLIEDRVEIGANTTIDRGSGPDTIIGAGCRIDNLVQIGHNVHLGHDCIVVALTGIAGSTTLGDSVVVGGQVGIAGHLTIGGGAQIGAQSGIMKNIGPGEKVIGSPSLPAKQFMRQVAVLKRLALEKWGE
ncbi:UDP-3-O-(3-hydroxymyristoyl)glucosamine N-acyltransferase [Alphaproteobacteria bacterium]|nr:UDP-3-O-(3-hydroxymyristoyl)glucosamine N-acyltransferase [Alphaproteobacteria bacterium]